MTDDDVQPVNSTILTGDIRPAPRPTSRWTGSGRTLMIGVLAALGILVVALLILLTTLVQRAVDTMQHARRSHEVEARAAERRAVEDAAREDRRRAARPLRLTDPVDWITSDDYPVDALRADEEGTVTITWVATPDGRISDCKTLYSSGHVSLDRAACSAILRRGRYAAVPSAQGPRVFTRRVLWRIPR